MRHKLFSVVLAVLLVPAAVHAESLIQGIVTDDHPRDRFIVTFDSEMVRGESEIHARANELAAAHGAEILSVYTIVGGFYARMPESAAEAIARLPLVKRVTHDVAIQTAQQVQPNPDWGLDRIDQRGRSLDNQYIYAFDGDDVNIFIVDSGVLETHNDFGGRVLAGGNYIQDGNHELTGCGTGHGTHVAGIAAGALSGIGKQAWVRSVRVLDCSGGGSLGVLLDALEDIRHDIINASIHRVVVNLSVQLTTPQILPDLDDRIEKLIYEANAVVVHAAGNIDIDACTTSPNHVRAISVGATNKNDERAPFPQGGRSNWGSCVDIFSPGIEIKSAGIMSNTDTNVMSGTSMSSPFVSGKVALFIEQNPGFANDPDSVKERIITYNATHNALDSATLPSGTPNKLMFSRDGLYRPDKSLQFLWCSMGLATYELTSHGNFGPENESYMLQVQRDGSSFPWDTFSTSNSGTFQVNANSIFRVRANYTVSLGTSSWNTSGWVTAPSCQDPLP